MTVYFFIQGRALSSYFSELKVSRCVKWLLTLDALVHIQLFFTWCFLPLCISNAVSSARGLISTSVDQAGNYSSVGGKNSWKKSSVQNTFDILELSVVVTSLRRQGSVRSKVLSFLFFCKLSCTVYKKIKEEKPTREKWIPPYAKSHRNSFHFLTLLFSFFFFFLSLTFTCRAAVS